MKLNTLIEGCKENCKMQEALSYHQYFRSNFPFLIFAIIACPEHVSKCIEGNGMKFDTLIDG